LPKWSERIRLEGAGGRIISAKLIPLKNAPWAFAPQRLRDEWVRAREAEKRTRKTSITPESIQKPENIAEAFKLFAEGMNEWAEQERVRSAPMQAMQDSLLQKLREGNLAACGVQFAPKLLRDLEIIPDHFFRKAKINWADDKVTNFGVTYGVVHVQRRSPAASRTSTQKTLNVTANTSRSALAKPSGKETSEANAIRVDAQARALTPLKDHESAETQRRKPGPRSGEAEVIAAFNRLLQKGPLRDGITKKEIYNKLLPDLRANSTSFQNGRGLAYSSIARHLRPLLLSKFSS
jgi:hypothetical protein